MNKNKDDEIFGYIAKEYQNELGKQLHKENQLIDTMKIDTAGLDKKVRRGTKKRRNIIQFSAAIAAGLLLLLGLPLMYSSQTANMETADQPNKIEETAASSDDSSAAIELSFTLPDNFTLTRTEQDKEMSVYYLADSNKDPVVMQLTPADSNVEIPAENLKQIDIDGHTVYAISQDSYNLITFQHQELQYTLTCVYDINTIAGICKNIF